MRVLCRHGHFAFFPRREYEIFIFNDLLEVELVRSQDFYTFPILKDLPDYSLVGQLYGNFPSITRYEGNPWEIMRENRLVYSLETGLLVPRETIFVSINPVITGEFFLADTLLIQPGSSNYIGQRILSYDAEFLQDKLQLRVIEYSYE